MIYGSHVIYNSIGDKAVEEIDDDRTYWNVYDKTGKEIKTCSFRGNAREYLMNRERIN